MSLFSRFYCIGRTANVSFFQVAARSCSDKKSVHTLPELPYAYNALEPIISAEIMTLHHTKHHATYVNNLNAAEKKLASALAKGDIEEAVALEPAMRFNGGGHLNHSIFWSNLSPNGGGLPPKGRFFDQLLHDFGSFDMFKSALTNLTVGIQGSGWGWLGFSPRSRRLRIAACPNQDPLMTSHALVPILGIDVWEHAYYLQYKNVRADYVNAIWNIINWSDIEQRYIDALAGKL